jgi:hypothetical protein
MPTLESIQPKLIAPTDMFGQLRVDMLPKEKGGILARRFGVVPFSVLDARQGYWQERKRLWIELGIKGEEGRQDTESANNICSDKYGRGQKSEFYEANAARCDGHGLSESQERLDAFKRKADPVPGGGGPHSVRRLAPKDAGRCFGQDLMKGEHVLGTTNVAADKGYGFAAAENASLDEKQQRALGVYAATNGAVQERGGGGVAGTSVFDPVLCECVYKWFTPPGGKILDPFAGESTKGIVAGFLGYHYTGVELRPEQVKANNRQAGIVAEKVKSKTGEDINTPTWVNGDSGKLGAVLDEHDPFCDGYDFIWTSPPYFDLEIYSQSEKDGSAFETYPKFMAWYEDIFRMAVARLKPNRFVAVKVGEIRDDAGFYRNFERDNISVFERLGLKHYNRIVLVTAVGSLPVRIGAQFPKYRKVGNTHQMVYIFWKGDSAKAIPQELGVLAQEDINNDKQQAQLAEECADAIVTLPQ